MKRGSLLFVVLSLLNINPVYSAAGDVYLLPKFGVMSIALKDADPLISYGVMWGFGLSKKFSTEIEYNSGFSGGEYEDNTKIVPVAGHYRVVTYAGYLVYRHPIGDSSYIKSKFGLLHEIVGNTKPSDSDVTQMVTIESKDTGLAGGIGLGSSIGERLTLEFEITLIDKDIVFYSLGTHYNF